MQPSFAAMSRLTLLLPHVLTPAQQRLPALETLLTRGERHCDQPTGLPQRLLQLCDLAPAAPQELPLGPLCALGDGVPATAGYWLRAEPVHLVADQDKVYLAARAAELAVKAEEAALLAAEFNALFRDDGWLLQTPTATRWYLRLPQTWQLRTMAPDNAVGCDVWPLLPQGVDGRRLHAALTEIQMLFHASAVNARRNNAGLPAINSLWLWGGAELPPVPQLPWQHLQGDDCLLRGIAMQAGIPCAAVAADAATWLRDGASELMLLTDDLTQLEQRWFAPLLDALRRGRLAQLDIHLTSTPCSYRIDRRAARRWWRRRRPLADWWADSGTKCDP